MAVAWPQAPPAFAHRGAPVGGPPPGRLGSIRHPTPIAAGAPLPQRGTCRRPAPGPIGSIRHPAPIAAGAPLPRDTCRRPALGPIGSIRHPAPIAAGAPLLQWDTCRRPAPGPIGSIRHPAPIAARAPLPQRGTCRRPAPGPIGSIRHPEPRAGPQPKGRIHRRPSGLIDVAQSSRPKTCAASRIPPAPRLLRALRKFLLLQSRPSSVAPLQRASAGDVSKGYRWRN